MADHARISISLEKSLLKQLDRAVVRDGYPTRSEAVKTLIRRGLVRKEWAAKTAEVAGAVTVVYDHHKKELLSGLMDVQHDFGEVVISTQHIHLDHHNCLEIVVVKGAVGRIQKFVSKLKSLKGVKHNELVMTTTGKELG